ncbi:MAG: cobyrinate a,c-diamide synthase [Lachnospiraceae bacterium]|nr:cobyrinate a,c-diamide synthase [Lachnospiraceae bacterium]
MRVQTFKAGPDYIDPLFHDKVFSDSSYSTLGLHNSHGARETAEKSFSRPALRRCENLDPFFSDPDTLVDIFVKASAEAEISVIEGVMGLYDGIGTKDGKGSTYALASGLKVPIVLIVDAKGASRSLLALIKGFLDYDEDSLIKGVILNRCGMRLHDSLAPVIEEELGIRVFGYLPENKDIEIQSRYLGLVTPDELVDINQKLGRLGALIAETMDLDGLAGLTGLDGLTMSCSIPYDALADRKVDLPKAEDNTAGVTGESGAGIKLGVAYDEAFCFYYRENLRQLRRAGFDIVWFSPLNDPQLPDGISGIYLGGGYPELWAEKLEENRTIMVDITQKIGAGMPVIAECGGYMYLTRSIGSEGYGMCGVFGSECSGHDKTVRFGYVKVSDRSGYWLAPGQTILGHEFHYYDSSDNGDGAEVTKASTGVSYRAGHVTENIWAGWPHLYFRSAPAFTEAFYSKCDAYMQAERRKNEQ